MEVQAVKRGTLKRRGHSLVELMAVITGVSVVMGGVATLLTFALRMHDDARDRTRTVTTIGRLAEQFRRDVHEAQGEVSVSAGHDSVEVDIAEGHAIRWGFDKHGNVYRGETNARTSRETTYRLPKGTTATFEVHKHGPSQVVVVKIDSADLSGPSLAIEALAGEDNRFAAEEEK
jgi:hypothetical protein